MLITVMGFVIFLNGKKGDSLTTVKFDMKQCLLYLELILNVWGSVRPEGKTTVWLASSSLPLNFSSIYVHFTVKCDEIGYDQSKKVTLQNSRNE